MTITAALIVYAVTWFLTFFIVIQTRTVAQSDTDRVEPGTPPGAPAQEVVGRMARETTIWATLIWAAICAVILSGWITIADLEVLRQIGR